MQSISRFVTITQCFSPSGSRKHFMNLLTTNSHYFDKCVRISIFFANVITCSDTVSLSTWPSYYKKWRRSLSTSITSLLTKNYQISQTKLLLFSAEIIVLLAEVSQFAEYLAKHGKIQIYEIMKTDSRYKSHKKNHSTKLRLMQKYINAYMCIFISLNL